MEIHFKILRRVKKIKDIYDQDEKEEEKGQAQGSDLNIKDKNFSPKDQWHIQVERSKWMNVKND